MINKPQVYKKKINIINNNNKHQQKNFRSILKLILRYVR